MALSGSVSTNGYDGRYYTVSWTAKQSIADNYSDVSWTLSCAGGSANWYAERTLTVVVAGSTVVSKTDRVQRYAGTIASGTVRVSHDSNGAAGFSISISAAVYTSSVNCTGSGSFTLDTIARVSYFSVSTNIDLGKDIWVSWEPHSSSLTFTVSFTCGSKTHTTGIISPGTTAQYDYYYNAAIAEWAPYITGATTASMTVTLTAYSGSTIIGTYSSTITVKVPSSVVPSITGVVLSEAGDLPSAWAGKWVKGYSKIQAAITAAGIYSSTITSYALSFDGSTVAGGSGTQTMPAVIATTGDRTVAITITDSRGRAASYSETIEALNYNPPSTNLTLAISGSTVIVKYSGSVYSVGGQNAKSYVIKAYDSNGDEYDSYTINDWTAEAGVTSLP